MGWEDVYGWEQNSDSQKEKQNLFQYTLSLQKLPESVGDLGKLIVAKGFENLSKVQLIAQSGHTGDYCPLTKKCSLI